MRATRGAFYGKTSLTGLGDFTSPEEFLLGIRVPPAGSYDRSQTCHSTPRDELIHLLSDPRIEESLVNQLALLQSAGSQIVSNASRISQNIEPGVHKEVVGGGAAVLEQLDIDTERG